MKLRSPNSTRLLDEQGFRRRAACVCVKDDNENEILLVSRGRNPNEWVFPGGGVEPDEETCDAATREVFEEAGVKGAIVRCLGVFQNEKSRTGVFVFKVTDELNEWDDAIRIGRRRAWFTLEEARNILGESHSQLTYLDLLKSRTFPISSTPNNVSNNNYYLGHSITCCTEKQNQPLATASCGNVLSNDLENVR